MADWRRKGTLTCIQEYLQERKNRYPGSQYTIYIPCLNEWITTIKNPEYLEQSNNQLCNWILDPDMPIKGGRSGYSLTYYTLKNEMGKISGYLIEDSDVGTIDIDDILFLTMYVIAHIDAKMYEHATRCGKSLPSVEDFLYDIRIQESCVVAAYRIEDLKIRAELSLAEWEKKKGYILKLFNKKKYYRIENDTFLLFFTADIEQCYNDIVQLQKKIPGEVTVLIEDVPNGASWDNLFRLIETLKNRPAGTVGILNRISMKEDMGILELFGGCYEVEEMNEENDNEVCARTNENDRHSFNASDFFNRLQ